MTAPRALIIGAGHNGLVCAAHLTAAGLDVTVLEQAEQPGGCVISAEDTIPGFVHDRGAGFFPLARMSPALRRLDLERDGLEWITPDLPMVHPFEDGSAICLARDLAATAASLDAITPGAGGQWARLAERLTPHREQLLGAALARFPPVAPATRLAVHLRRDGLELARRLLGSVAALGREVLGSDRAAAWLAGSASHSDLGPGAAGTAAVGLFLTLLGHWVGWPIPRGGAGRLTDMLIARVQSHGGVVRCGARVERILRRDRSAVGVELESGEQLGADIIVATVSARPLGKMLDAGALPERVMSRLRGWRYGIGTLKVDFALSGSVPWRAEEARRAAVVHLGGELAEMFDAFHQAGIGTVPAALPLVVGQQSLFDRTRAPQGGETLYVYARIVSDPGPTDEQLADLVQQRIELFAPGFSRLVLGKAVRSPRRLERENPSLVGGDLAGGSLELDQLLLFRPAPELVRYRTPLGGLYVAGASVHPGPAVHGASGEGAARALLGDLARRRPWRRGRVATSLYKRG